jgi:hypothetical protein
MTNLRFSNKSLAKSRGEIRCSGMLSSYWSTIGIRRDTRIKIYVIKNEETVTMPNEPICGGTEVL